MQAGAYLQCWPAQSTSVCLWNPWQHHDKWTMGSRQKKTMLQWPRLWPNHLGATASCDRRPSLAATGVVINRSPVGEQHEGIDNHVVSECPENKRSVRSNNILFFLDNCPAHPECVLPSCRGTVCRNLCWCCHHPAVKFAYSKKSLHHLLNYTHMQTHLRTPGGRLNKKDRLTGYDDSHVKDKTSYRPSYL